MGANRGARGGAVLLEIVFALVLFVAAAASVTGGLSACIQAAEKVRIQGQAADLAVTKLSEIQMDLVPIINDEVRAFEEVGLEDWTWQTLVEPVEMKVEMSGISPMRRLEIVVRHVPSGLTYRLTELLPEETTAAVGQEAEQ